MMLRWRKEAHTIGPRKRQLMRDDQPDGMRKLKKRTVQEKVQEKKNIKIYKRTSDKIYKPIGNRYVDYDIYSSSGLMLFTSSLMFGCCTLANR